MKQLGWLASASVLFVMVVALEGWPAWRDLSRNNEWRDIDATPSGASMNGLQVMIEEQIAVIAPQRPERAGMLVRLKLKVTPEARQAWIDCRVSLHNEAGQTWMPLTSANTHGAIKAMTPDHKDFGLCTLYPQGKIPDTETVRADQLFLLPSNGLEGLRLHVSGLGTRPHTLSFALNPNIKRLP